MDWLKSSMWLILQFCTGVFWTFEPLTNPFSLSVLRRSRNFSKAKSFYSPIPGPGIVSNKWFLCFPYVVHFLGRGMYEKDGFRTLFISLVVPGWRFLYMLEQLNHTSKLCLTVVEPEGCSTAKNNWRAVCSD